MALITAVKAAEIAGCDRHKIAEWAKAGVFPVFVDPISGRKRYSEESLRSWLAGFQPSDGAA